MGEFFGFMVLMGIVGVLFLYTSFAWGYVLFKFYYWFMIPIFGNSLPAINATEAIGIMIFMGLFKNHNIPSLKEDLYEQSFGTRLLQSIVNPWITLGIAYFIKSVLM